MAYQKNRDFTLFYRTGTIRGMNRCLNCALEISEKATYCSDKCRMAYTRRTKDGEQPEQNDPNILPEQPTRTFDFELTRTDRKFEKCRPWYYNFVDESFKRDCLQCGGSFTTHLKLLRFCSPVCMNEALTPTK